MRLAVACLLLAPAVAAAEPIGGFDVTSTSAGLDLARQIVPATAATRRAQSRTIFLNRNGAMLKPGVNDSRKNTSSVVAQPSMVPAWTTSDAKWAATVACLREIWAPFDVTLTETDPGPATPHVEALFGGSPANIGMSANVSGVSPFALDCGIIENSIVFAFTDKLPDNPRIVCEVMSQEIGHSYGLDHELLASDPMTYLSYGGERSFRDQTASCGESQPRACGIGGNTCRPDQNSAALLRERLGRPGDPDTEAPHLRIASPVEGELVEPGFAIRANAADDVAIASVAFAIDGEAAGVLGTAPYDLATDADLAPGEHTITVEASDEAGNLTVAEVTIRVRDTGNTANRFDLALGCSSTRSTGLLTALLALAAITRRRR
ncbi:MAG: hypothetical protein KF773_33085 [Deltaproteobacteria bacterium]|nr:hypothetical protein [Deltaproteobacteria bacterium]